ncbi:MAG: hypothetical protein KME04_00695 [Pleurocapsa minor GSE-CHR-MK-17-07R]|jgi:hypothetical protein|nr:hypothetical protein [Pleurocapsa minor GSE-CHR-MK 17-07R]
MKRRDIAFLAFGGVLGLVVALVLLTSPDIQRALSGTAMGIDAEPAYLIVDNEQAQQWLLSVYPDDEEAILSAFANAGRLATTTTFPETFREVEADINQLSDRAFAALTGRLPDADAEPSFALPDALLTDTAAGDIVSCVGLDENPYNFDGYSVELYMEIPSTQLVNLPSEWATHDDPMSRSLFWQRLACHALTGDMGERSR